MLLRVSSAVSKATSTSRMRLSAAESDSEATLPLGKKPEGRKVKGVIHWVSVRHGIEAEVRVYDRLFNHASPDASKDGKEYTDHINPTSLLTLTQCFVEPAVDDVQAGDSFQFEREGYFSLDSLYMPGDMPVFNRTVTLRDTWAKIEQQGKK